MPEIGRTLITYGVSEDADFKVSDFKECGMGSHFVIERRNAGPLEVDLPIPGLHMAKNAAAAVAVAVEEGIADDKIVKALREFRGVGRRFQCYGDFNIGDRRITLVDDYGHHPTEVGVTIDAARMAFPGRKIFMVFQPHRYTRTRDLYDDFVKVLQKNDKLILLEVYSAGEEVVAGADSRHLSRSIRNMGKIDPVYAQNAEEIPALIENLAEDGDVILTQGAGNVTKVAHELSKRWEKI